MFFLGKRRVVKMILDLFWKERNWIFCFYHANLNFKIAWKQKDRRCAISASNDVVMESESYEETQTLMCPQLEWQGDLPSQNSFHLDYNLMSLDFCKNQRARGSALRHSWTRDSFIETLGRPPFGKSKCSFQTARSALVRLQPSEALGLRRIPSSCWY